jgi:glutamyl-tRNA synthetase
MISHNTTGASRRVINMEWDKFWSENKKILEGEAPRYMANSADRKVLMTVTNLGPEVTVDSVQIHPQKPEMGMRALRKCNSIYLEMDDCNTFSEGEEVSCVTVMCCAVLSSVVLCCLVAEEMEWRRGERVR